MKLGRGLRRLGSGWVGGWRGRSVLSSVIPMVTSPRLTPKRRTVELSRSQAASVHPGTQQQRSQAQLSTLWFGKSHKMGKPFIFKATYKLLRRNTEITVDLFAITPRFILLVMKTATFSDCLQLSRCQQLSLPDPVL